MHDMLGGGFYFQFPVSSTYLFKLLITSLSGHIPQQLTIWNLFINS